MAAIWDNVSARIFVVTLGALAVVFLGWGATGRPFPGQALPVTSSDMAAYQATLVAAGLLQEDPEVVNARLWVPMDEDWRGIASTLSTLDGRYRAAVWLGRGPASYEADVEGTGTWRRVSRAFGDAVVTTWDVPGERHAGLALWGSPLTPEDEATAENLAAQVQAATGGG